MYACIEFAHCRIRISSPCLIPQELCKNSWIYNRSISNLNIPILPEAFLTFASKSSVGPSYVANGQEDNKTYTNLNDDTIIMVNNCYFDSIA